MFSVFAAVERGDAKMTGELVGKLEIRRAGWHSPINKTDFRCRTPLHLAVERGHDGVVDVLLSHKDIDLSAKDCGGFTALHLAVELGHDKIVARLLEKRPELAGVKAENARGLTALHVAALKGHAAIVEQLLAVSVEVMDFKDKPAYHLAMKHGHEELAAVLVGNLESRSTEDCMVLLRSAIKHGYDLIAAHIITQRPASIKLKDPDGRTALFLAARYGREAVVDLLLAQEPALIHTRGRSGETPLHEAACWGHDGLVARFLGLHPELARVATDCGETPLLEALWRGHDRSATLVADARLSLQSKLPERSREEREAQRRRREEWEEERSKTREEERKREEREERRMREEREERRVRWASEARRTRAGDDGREHWLLHFAFARRTSEQYFSEDLMRKAWQIDSDLSSIDRRGETPFYVAVRHDNKFAMELVQGKLSLEEITRAFAKYDRKCPQTVFDKVREPLVDSLTQDVAELVWECLGLPSTPRPNKRMRTGKCRAERTE